MVNIVVKIVFFLSLIYCFYLNYKKNPSYIYMNINVVASISVE